MCVYNNIALNYNREKLILLGISFDTLILWYGVRIRPTLLFVIVLVRMNESYIYRGIEGGRWHIYFMKVRIKLEPYSVSYYYYFSFDCSAVLHVCNLRIIDFTFIIFIFIYFCRLLAVSCKNANFTNAITFR